MNPCTNKITALLLTLVTALCIASCGGKEDAPRNLTFSDTQWTCHWEDNISYGYYQFYGYVDSEIEFTSDSTGHIVVDYFIDLNSQSSFIYDTLSSGFTYVFNHTGDGMFQDIQFDNYLYDYPAVYNADQQTITVSVTDPNLSAFGIKELVFTRK